MVIFHVFPLEDAAQNTVFIVSLIRAAFAESCFWFRFFITVQ